MKIFDHLATRFPTAVLSLACTLALGACDKAPVAWRGDALSVPIPTSGDESSAPVDAHLVLRSDGSPALEAIAAVPSMPHDSLACAGSFRVSALSSTEIYGVWWSKRAGGRAALLASRSDDAGGTWMPPVPVDTTDRGAAGCSRPAPAIAADGSSGYVHVAYFLNAVGGPGVFFAHSMERGELFHSPVPIMYGDRPSSTAVAAADSVVVVAFEDPNSERAQIALAMSRTWGHIFTPERPEVSIGTPEAQRPLVALRKQSVAVGWRGKDRGIVARVGTLRMN
ncbi:MAG TPA: sialidase family protein [Gemmatimonadaceae bacterium]|nr:sialidase family protein [Gemmatimonadaceae bacterium]